MGDELQELAEDIARGALNISWRDTESAARRVAEHSADRIGQLEPEAQLQAQEIDKTRRRADEWQSMVLDCEKYLKPGETPRQRMDRDHADVLAMMKLLEIEKRKSEGFELALGMVEGYNQFAHIAHDMKTGIFPQRSKVSEYLSEIIRAKIQENDDE